MIIRANDASVPERYTPPHPKGLMGDSLASPWGSSGAWATMSDGAGLWYTECGEGPALLLVHGWTASSRFWLRNVPELAKHFRVITPDLRGHGSSTKVLQGHTIRRYAQDMRELLLSLGVNQVVLAGWSMGGSICLEYWRRYTLPEVRGIVLLDSNLGPFADQPWNGHRLREGKADAMNDSFQALYDNPEASVAQSSKNLFYNASPSPEDLAWAMAESRKTPPWIAAAIYSDYLVRNYEPLLPQVTIPAAVFSGVFGELSLERGEHFASQFPNGSYYGYPDCGHMPFYEAATRFNKDLTKFMHSITS